jgi:hypothetical protein
MDAARGLDAADLRPGDVLIYGPSSAFGWIIAVKTSQKVSHTETYLGDGKSAASRDGQGVATYPLRLSGLRYVLRPERAFRFDAGLAWHNGWIGAKYDWWGLLSAFELFGHGSEGKFWCSEHTANFALAEGLQPFPAHYRPDMVSPANWLAAADYAMVFNSEKGWSDSGHNDHQNVA